MHELGPFQVQQKFSAMVRVVDSFYLRSIIELFVNFILLISYNWTRLMKQLDYELLSAITLLHNTEIDTT